MKITVYTPDGIDYYCARAGQKILLDGTTKVWHYDLGELLGRPCTKEDAEAFLAGFVAALDED